MRWIGLSLPRELTCLTQIVKPKQLLQKDATCPALLNRGVRVNSEQEAPDEPAGEPYPGGMRAGEKRQGTVVGSIEKYALRLEHG